MGTGNNYRRLITIVSFIIGTGLYVNPLADIFSIHHSTDLVLIMTQLPKKNQSHGYAQARLLLQRKSRSSLAPLTQCRDSDWEWGSIYCAVQCQFYGYNLLNWIPGWSTDTSEWWGKFLEMGNLIHVRENKVFFLLENPHKLWYLFQLQFNYKKCASFCKQSHANTTNPYNTLCHSPPHLSSISCS